MLKVKYLSIGQLKPYANNARTHGKKQISQIARSIQDFGFNVPILIDKDSNVIAGHGRLLAAEELQLAKVPTIRLENLTELQKKAYILADNKLAEKAGWDTEILKIELEGLQELDIDFDLTQTGFETPEIDLIINGTEEIKEDNPLDDLPEESEVKKQVKPGELWKLGEHYLYCGDSLKKESFKALLGRKKANLIFADPPYNVKIDGHVCGSGKIKHDEFTCASGEMSEPEFTGFLKTSFELLASFSNDGSIHYVCMDWRHVAEITAAGKQAYSELKNICVWNKQLGGMGSLYRSQHELIFVFKNGESPHMNNIELGKHGRYRTNIWDYPGVNTCGHHRKDLKLHPTVKPVLMISDAIKDCSKQGDVILDPFGGSGSTLLAAEMSRRKAYLIEYEAKYCDVTIHRFEKATGKKAKLVKGVSDD